MIQSFADAETEKVFRGERSKKLPNDIQDRACGRLFLIATANRVEDLRVPSSNQLHLLTGARAGTWAIRINMKWRITFQWGFNGAENVKIEDYHK